MDLICIFLQSSLVISLNFHNMLPGAIFAHRCFFLIFFTVEEETYEEV